MRSLLTAIAVCSMLGLAACQNGGHKDHGDHGHGAGEACCGTDGSCCAAPAEGSCCGTGGSCCSSSEIKSDCTTCDAVGKVNCATCKS